MPGTARNYDGRLCQAASTSASRSGVIPALSFCRSAGCDLNQASVSRAVVASGRNVSPLAIALVTLIRPIPASSPRGGTHTGISDQGATFCSSRKSVLTHVKLALELFALLIPSSIAPTPNVLSGPVAL